MNLKQIVAVLLPVVFLLGVVYSIPNLQPLKADDSEPQLVNVKINEKEGNKNTIISESTCLAEISSKEPQLLKFFNSKEYAIQQVDKSGKNIPGLEISLEELKQYQDKLESAKLEEMTNQLLFVRDTDGKETQPYFFFSDEQQVYLKFTSQTEESIPVALQTMDDKFTQTLFTYQVNKISSTESQMNSTESLQAERTQDLSFDESESVKELLEADYKEEDSFKPIELPLESAARESESIGTLAAPAVAVTGAKMTVRTGTSPFDSNNTAGYDSSATNTVVRSFDSIVYLLAFTVEASDPMTSYTDIKYRVDMDLPKAFANGSDGKERFNAEIVDAEHGMMVNESNGTKTSKGYVESTIKNNGQVLLPVIVNVYGAEHNTSLRPNMKITIISAKNAQTGQVETINTEYTQTSLSQLKLPATTVSAKASITAKLVKGKRVVMSKFAAVRNDNWEAVSLGITFALKPLSGRGADDFRGSTFPKGEILTKINSDSIYRPLNGADIPLDISQTAAISGGYTRPVHAMTYSTATNKATGWTQILHNTKTLNINDSLIPVDVPYGKTGNLHVVEPQVSTEAKKTIGVYDSGTMEAENTVNALIITANDYAPVYNPYTYTMYGEATNANEKMFFSGMMIVEWCKEYMALKGGTGAYITDLDIDLLRYEGRTYTDINSTVTISDNRVPSGSHTAVGVFTGANPQEPLSTFHNWSDTTGDGTIGQGAKMYAGGVSIVVPEQSTEVESIIRWNANSFEYDPTRQVHAHNKGYIPSKTRYGVGRTKNHPTLVTGTKAQIDGEYTWYDTPEKALAKGKISAVKFFYNKNGGGFSTWNGAPVIAVGPVGYKDSQGNPNVVLSHPFYYLPDGTLDGFVQPVGHTYVPSVFDSNGKKTGGHTRSSGDTLYIKPFSITTTTEPEKPTYQTTELVKWKVIGSILSESDVQFAGRLTTTIPKGLSYDVGSAVDGSGKPFSEYSVKKNADGTTTVIWDFDNQYPKRGDRVEVNFTTTPVLNELTFNNISVAQLEVKTVGEVWRQSNPSQYDTTVESQRSSAGQINLYQMQQVTIEKSVDKKQIEVGENDPSGATPSTAIKYRIKVKNDSAENLSNVKILDVLPYDDDSLGSKFDGSYTLTSIRNVQGTAQFSYTNTITAGLEDSDPNTITGWTTYTSGAKDVKALLFTVSQLKIGEEYECEITLQPNGQKAGNIFRNRATLNDSINLPVKSNVVETKVYGRDLSGYVWYDDDYDGLIGLKSNGLPEEPVADVFVKLYRTSQTQSSYVKQLVETSLTGEKFIDSVGNSLIKTDSSGNYKFENLPEGEYIAEFMVGDMVVSKKVIVTKQLVGSDPTKNSKADPTTYQTPAYNHPILDSLSDILTSTDKIHHITDVNAGLVRQSEASKIRLFKYEEGSVIDEDLNGKLSNEEIEKTGKPLKNAEFDIFKGDSTDPADKIGSAKTDATGWLEFDGLQPGDYTLVETKAPEGYELIKNPIRVSIPSYGYIATIYVSDNGQTVLPFTGGTSPMQILIIFSGCTILLGMLGMAWQYQRLRKQGGR